MLHPRRVRKNHRNRVESRNSLPTRHCFDPKTSKFSKPSRKCKPLASATRTLVHRRDQTASGRNGRRRQRRFQTRIGLLQNLHRRKTTSHPIPKERRHSSERNSRNCPLG